MCQRVSVSVPPTSRLQLLPTMRSVCGRRRRHRAPRVRRLAAYQRTAACGNRAAAVDLKTPVTKTMLHPAPFCTVARSGLTERPPRTRRLHHLVLPLLFHIPHLPPTGAISQRLPSAPSPWPLRLPCTPRLGTPRPAPPRPARHQLYDSVGMGSTVVNSANTSTARRGCGRQLPK